MLAIIGVAFSVQVQAQEMNRKEEKAARKAEREAQKAEEERIGQALFQEARQALESQSFVLEADRIIFKRGQSAYVTSNRNFVSLADGKATVQIAFDGPYSGPNGVGGITVEGIPTNIKMKEDRRGNISFTMNVNGAAVSAQIAIRLSEGSNDATVNVIPTFSGNNMTLNGKLLPAEKSKVFKGRSL